MREFWFCVALRQSDGALGEPMREEIVATAADAAAAIAIAKGINVGMVGQRANAIYISEGTRANPGMPDLGSADMPTSGEPAPIEPVSGDLPTPQPPPDPVPGHPTGPDVVLGDPVGAGTVI